MKKESKINRYAVYTEIVFLVGLMYIQQVKMKQLNK